MLKETFEFSETSKPKEHGLEAFRKMSKYEKINNDDCKIDCDSYFNTIFNQ